MEIIHNHTALVDSASRSVEDSIETVMMHTYGEPTRIVVRGYPKLEGGSLLEKRRIAREKYDHIRKRIMQEPRGHRDMYGAILVQETELTKSGEADIGVLFCHNEGYSTMCGHATLALGRFLVDTSDHTLFPRRDSLSYDTAAMRTQLRIHAPCGIVQVSVPVVLRSDGDGTFRSDPSRAVSFLSVPSYSVGLELALEIPEEYQWPELTSLFPSSEAAPVVTLDIGYGGAFYAIVHASQLGFPDTFDFKAWSSPDSNSLHRLNSATKLLKRYIQNTPHLSSLLRHPEASDLEFLYGVTVVFSTPSQGLASSDGPVRSDVNLCFFASQQLDRSPTGSCVSARVAVQMAKGQLAMKEVYEFHSIVSTSVDDAEKRKAGAFCGLAYEEVDIAFPGTKGGSETRKGVIVKVEGKTFYTGKETFVVEKEDFLQDGFWIP